MIRDYKSLKYSMTTGNLLKRQAYKAEFLSELNFVMFYNPGIKNGKANPLICLPNNSLAGY